MRLSASGEGVCGQISHAGLRAVTEGIDPYTVLRHLKVEMGSFRLDIWAYSVVLPLP